MRRLTGSISKGSICAATFRRAWSGRRGASRLTSPRRSGFRWLRPARSGSRARFLDSVAAEIRVRALHLEERGILGGDPIADSAGGDSAVDDVDVALERRRGGGGRGIVYEDDHLVDRRGNASRGPQVGDLADLSRLKIGESLGGPDFLAALNVVEGQNDSHVLHGPVDVGVAHADVGAELAGDGRIRLGVAGRSYEGGVGGFEEERGVVGEADSGRRGR